MNNNVVRRDGSLSLQLDLNRVARWVIFSAIAILVISYIRLFVIESYGLNTPIRNFRYFDLDEELAIPAWYSSIVLLGSGIALLAISRLAKREGSGDQLRWTVLGFVFVGMGLDEAVSIHERIIDPLRDGFNLSGIFYFSWVIPALILVAAFALYMVPLLLRVPRRTVSLFLLAGGLYIGGALGMEMVGGAVASLEGTETLRYRLIVATEETLEIVGLTLFFVSLVDHIGRTWPLWSLVVRTETEN